MNTDRELLELAAKAAGIVGKWVENYSHGDYYYHGSDDGICYERAEDGADFVWNPLTDDRDALRLVVKLGMQITPGTYLTQSATAYCPGSQAVEEHVHYQQDMLTATRRAIVRAAAEIGKRMP